MAPRRRAIALAAIAATAVLAGFVSAHPELVEGLDRWFRGTPALERSPALVAEGERVLASRCLHCHGDIPLRPRVSGWSVARAYDAIGRLPELNASMPSFAGTERERRALAAYLAALGEPLGPRAP